MDQIILFDMDNTLCDWDGAMRRDLKRVVPPEYKDKVEAWLGDERRERPDWVEDLMTVIRTQAGWWRDLKPLKVGMDLLKLVLFTDWETNVLTKGPHGKPAAWTEKKEWCLKHIVRDVPVTIAANKALVYGKVLVDDYPPYVESWLKWRKNGLAILPAQSYNKGFSHPNAIRISNDGEMDMERAKAALDIAFNRKMGEPLDLTGVR